MENKENTQPVIKIFVSHRIDQNATTIDNPLFVPVRCGAVYDKRDPKEYGNMLGDDTGDNISEKRNSFCELTVLYWAWKNQKADYYGLCHYRRYLSFTDKKYPEGKTEHDNGCVVENFLNIDSEKKYGLNNILNMENEIKNYDVIVNPSIDIRNGPKTNYNAMKISSDYHNIKDVDLALNIIKERFPTVYPFALEYMNSGFSRLYNCFIMKANIFNEFCNFLFGVLFELENRIDMRNYNVKKYRTPGTIGERLLGIYILYLLKKGLKIKVNQLIFFKNTTFQELPTPIAKNQITIAFNFNNNYVPIFSVFLMSLLPYISKNRFYQLVVLIEDITENSKQNLNNIIKDYPNVVITYYNPSYLYDGFSFDIKDCAVYSKDLFNRPLIPFIMENYEKVLVLDVDMICCDCIDSLYDMNISEYYAAAVRDTVYMGILNSDESRKDYTKKDLNLKNPFNYCNTGVLLLNTKKIIQKYTLKETIECAKKNKFMIYEQDMLNYLYGDKIYYLNPEWNVFTYTNQNFVEFYLNEAPYIERSKYEYARKTPKIIHYANNPKPWNYNGREDFRSIFWYYARMSPFYELILGKMLHEQTIADVKEASIKYSVVTPMIKNVRGGDICTVVSGSPLSRQTSSARLKKTKCCKENLATRFKAV